MLRKTLLATAALPFFLMAAQAQEAVQDDAVEDGAVETVPLQDDAMQDDAMQDDAMQDDAMQDPQPDAAPASDAAAQPVAPNAVVMSQQEANELRGDWIMGATVNSLEDEVIGSINDLILDTEDGRVTAAVVSVGGFLGFGAKQIAVDWNELQIDHDGQQVMLDLTREEADSAPEYAFRDRAEAPAPPPPPAADVAPAAPLAD